MFESVLITIKANLEAIMALLRLKFQMKYFKKIQSSNWRLRFHREMDCRNIFTKICAYYAVSGKET